MRRGRSISSIVGADRVAANGDVCNKIGTYDKALARRTTTSRFYVAVPSPTFDFALASGDAIPIEMRDAEESLERRRRRRRRRAVVRSRGACRHAGGELRVRRYPARLVSRLVTERGIAPATASGHPRDVPKVMEAAMSGRAR
jgi:methylthioribose-1-phosphate isomerase